MQTHHIAVGAFIGALSAYAVKGLVDLLFHRLGPRNEVDTHDALAHAARREIDRVRLRQRSGLYQDFDAKLQAAVHEMSQGWNRMSLIYAARDQYVLLRRLAPDPVARAARKMCDICVDMMRHGYSDVLHNRFHRAQVRFHEACHHDLTQQREDPDSQPDPHKRSTGSKRKYISPHN